MMEEQREKLKKLIQTTELPQTTPFFTQEVMEEIALLEADHVLAGDRLKNVLVTTTLPDTPVAITFKVMQRISKPPQVQVKPVFGRSVWMFAAFFLAGCVVGEFMFSSEVGILKHHYQTLIAAGIMYGTRVVTENLMFFIATVSSIGILFVIDRMLVGRISIMKNVK